MSPTRVFISIFAAGILLAVVLGIIGINQNDVAEEGAPDEAESGIVLNDIPESMSGCLACHGNNLEGAAGPSLHDVQLSTDEIIDILQNGIGSMPAQDLSEEEMQEVAEYLVNLDVGEQSEGDNAEGGNEAGETANEGNEEAEQ